MTADALVGRVLGGRYRLERLLGQGGMGAVFEAFHVHLERRVAVKVMPPERAADAEWIARFHREARLTSTIDSPHVVVVSDVGITDDGTRYAAMELLHGEDLRHRLAARGRLPVAEAVELIRQALAGLAAAHAKQVVHRDLKPDNIFLVPQPGGGELVKLLDFGISKHVGGDLGGAPGLTAAGMAVGTPAYMPPEQLLGQPVDQRADLYAIGAVLFQLLTGETPYQGSTFVELAAKHLTEPVPDVRQLRPDVPAHVAAAIDHALAKEVDARVPTATAFRDALTWPASAAAATLPDLPTAPRRARRGMLIAAGVGVVLVGTLIVIVGRSGSASPQIAPQPPPTFAPLLAAPQPSDAGVAPADVAPVGSPDARSTRPAPPRPDARRVAPPPDAGAPDVDARRRPDARPRTPEDDLGSGAKPNPYGP